MPARDIQRIGPEYRPLGPGPVVQAEAPEDIRVGVRVLAVERVAVVQMDHGGQRLLGVADHSTIFLPQYIR